MKRLFARPTAKSPGFATLDTLAAQARHEIQASRTTPAQAMLMQINRLCRGGVVMHLAALAAADVLYACVVNRKLVGLGCVTIRPHSYELDYLCSRHARCGSKIVGRIEKDAAASGRSLVFLRAVANAIGFYVKHGYAAVEADDNGLTVMVKYVKPQHRPGCKRVPPGPLLELYPQTPSLRAHRPHRLRKAMADIARGTLSVELDNVTLSTAEVAQLATALQGTTTVEELLLDRCQLQDAAITHLATMLAHNTTIRTLSLRHNHVQAAGANELANAIRANANSKIEYVLLDNNPMTAEDVEQVQRAVRQRLRAWT
jgi:hypothetical protein